MAKNKNKTEKETPIVFIEEQLKKDYIEYALSVITDRSIPAVVDGLKPVQRRILWDMRNASSYSKSARFVGSVLGKYHPHGDSSVYASMVRLSQNWKMMVPLVDGHGNFGSVDGDAPAAMRYCVTGDTIVDTIEYGQVPISEFAKGMEPNSDRIIEDLSVVSAFGKVNKVDRLFHSGSHRIWKMVLRNGMELRGTENHPVLTFNGKGIFEWKTLSQISVDDSVVLSENIELEDVGVVGTFHNNNVMGRVSSVRSIELTEDIEEVYSFRVCSECHSFITNGIVSHNTEARINSIAIDLYFTYNQMGLEFKPNYDSKESEPAFLTSPIPMILVNGSTGAAVGFATNIPPHNIKEVANTYKAFIDGKLTSKNIMKYLKGPDTAGFPCKIIDNGGIERAYISGKGSYYCMMDYHTEDASYGRTNIVFTSLLPSTDKTALIDKLVSAIKVDKYGLAGMIADIRDESGKDDIRIVITTKKSANVSLLIEKLTELRFCYDRYNIGMVALVDGCPRVLGIVDLLSEFHKAQVEISKNHLSRYLVKLSNKMEILDAISLAVKNYVKVSKIIISAKSKEEARTLLKKNYPQLSMEQVNAILDTKLINLVNKGDDIIKEQNMIRVAIKETNDHLNNINDYIKSNIDSIMAKMKAYTKRRSEIEIMRR